MSDKGDRRCLQFKRWNKEFLETPERFQTDKNILESSYHVTMESVLCHMQKLCEESPTSCISMETITTQRKIPSTWQSVIMLFENATFDDRCCKLLGWYWGACFARNRGDFGKDWLSVS